MKPNNSEEVILCPVQNVVGALSAYAGGKESLTEIRNNVWQEVADEKVGRSGKGIATFGAIKLPCIHT